MKALLVVCLLSLGACAQVADATATAKSFVYSKGARVGNGYCLTRDPAIAEGIKTRINTGLRAEGAKFEIDGTLSCDP